MSDKSQEKSETSLDHTIVSMYKDLPQYIKDDIVEASAWAKRYLTELEGSGHALFVTANKDGSVSCSFAKPEWGGDHAGRGMEHGAEAIVMAVCEYACGA